MHWTKHTRPTSPAVTWAPACVFLAVTGCGDAGRDEGGSSGGFGSVGSGNGNTAGASEGTASEEGSGGADPSDPGNTSGGAEDPSGSDGSGVDTNPNTGSGMEAGTKFDLPPGADSNGGADDGTTQDGECKIDFLFVIDSSCSMTNDQDNIDASLQGFVSTVETRFADHDTHIMVVDTDDVNIDDMASCRTGCALGLFTTCGATPCSMLPPEDGCSNTLGVGINTTPMGASCNFMSGKRYILDGQPDLYGAFHCVTWDRDNTGFTDERAAGALVGAISPEMNAPGGCNEGFLRRDAILVITMITDEEDDPNDHLTKTTIDVDANSAGDPMSWRQAVVDAKNGDETAVVVLGLLGNPDIVSGTVFCESLVGGPKGEEVSIEGAEETHRLREFSNSFTHGSWAGICEPNYTPFFEQAVSVIDNACGAFVPPPE